MSSETVRFKDVAFAQLRLAGSVDVDLGVFDILDHAGKVITLGVSYWSPRGEHIDVVATDDEGDTHTISCFKRSSMWEAVVEQVGLDLPILLSRKYKDASDFRRKTSS